MANQLTDERTIGALESKTETHDRQINDIFRLIQVSADANAETALQQQATAIQLAELTRRVNGQHAPETCPNTVKVSELQQAYWMGRGGVLWFVGGGGLAIGTALGIVIKLGGH